MAKVILLNGVGSAGKTSIAKALREIAVEPIWHMEMDAFLSMLPERYLDHPDGLTFEPEGTDGPPCVAVRSGPLVEKTLSGMRHSVAAMAERGCNLVVDDVIFGNTAQGDARIVDDYRQLLASHDLVFVGVFAPLDALVERERSRGDRVLGLARWQFDRVHVGFEYDLTVDTGQHSAVDCADQIKRAFGL